MIPAIPRACRLLTLLTLLATAAVAVAAVPADNRPGAHDAHRPATLRPPAPTPGLTARSVEYGGVLHHVVALDLRRARLTLIGQAPGPGAVRSFAALDGWLAADGRRLAMATNAGLFHITHHPVGLHVERGVEYTPVERSTGGRGNFWLRPNGIFAVDRGRARIEDTADWPPPAFAERPPQLAVQSGPLLLHRGVIHPAFVADSTHLRVRSAVGVRDGSTVVFVISAGPVRFYDLAAMLRDQLGCPDALYLDGGISGLMAPGIPLSAKARAQTYAGFFVVEAPAAE